jgi:hypothetical protein
VGVESNDHCWKTVPALSSSPISAALEQLDLPAGDRALLAGQCPSLLEYLQQVPDPRDPRGVRHSLTSLLLVMATESGHRHLQARRHHKHRRRLPQPRPGCHPRASRARPQRAMTETGITPPCPDPGLMA